MDRAVKIWHIPFPSFYTGTDQKLVREDKPLFSSTCIHMARVLSINWIADDVLLSHNAPPIMAIPLEDEDELEIDPGRIVLWQWLGRRRFFPDGLWDEGDVRQTVLRGCASDYQESASYKIISSIPLPPSPTQYDTPPGFQVYNERDYHDPIVLYTHPDPKEDGITIINVADFPPRKPPPCRWADDELAEATGNLQISEAEPEPPRWDLRPKGGDGKVQACALLPGGHALVAAGGSNLWLWTVPLT
ncbi:hypothetical protein AAF712_000862 [Marasmius tenuissimus]|uniref:Uncharacterized protein n=1 Tax=Marasmius tenuissimus TaxID=585030 RepID=A0ABR3AES4_9AGAR